LKIIWLDYQNNYAGRSNWLLEYQTFSCLNLHNYFDELTKLLSDLYLYLNFQIFFLAKLFFSCRLKESPTNFLISFGAWSSHYGNFSTSMKIRRHYAVSSSFFFRFQIYYSRGNNLVSVKIDIFVKEGFCCPSFVC